MRLNHPVEFHEHLILSALQTGIYQYVTYYLRNGYLVLKFLLDHYGQDQLTLNVLQLPSYRFLIQVQFLSQALCQLIRSHQDREL